MDETITRTENAELELDMLRLTSGLFCVLVVSTFTVGSEEAQQVERSIRVECHGQLRHGVVAIGGETTGTTIKFDGTTWELALKDDASRAFAEAHHKKPVSVSGTLRRVVGVEVSARWIVDVEKLSEREAHTQKEGAGVTILGKLLTTVAAPGGTAATVVEADGVSWPLDLTADATLRTKAESLAQKPVVVTGRLERLAGTATPVGTIIRVSKLDASSRATAK